MTRKHRRRPPPSSPAFSISSSAADNNNKPRRSAAASIPTHHKSKAADYDGAGDFSDASSAYDESHQDTEEEESEPLENEDDVSNSPSSQKPINHISQINQIPSISYVKIAPLPIFHGFSTESPITHISRFTKVCRANIITSSSSSIDDVMLRRIFPATLDGEALLWYDLNIEPYSNLSWEEIKISFLQAYHRMELEDDLKSELMRINQGDNETVRSYFLRFQWILQKWQNHHHGLREELLKGVFVDGLRQEFHEWVLVQKPCSLNEALRLAFGYEEMRSIRSMKKNEEKQRNDDEEKKGIFERSVSMEEGENVGGDDVRKKKKKNECRCMKHQCSIKRIMRNASIVSTTSSYPL